VICVGGSAGYANAVVCQSSQLCNVLIRRLPSDELIEVPLHIAEIIRPLLIRHIFSLWSPLSRERLPGDSEPMSVSDKYA